MNKIVEKIKDIQGVPQLIADVDFELQING